MATSTIKTSKQSANITELLFISRSSRDNKGKRVLVRYAGTENILFPGDENEVKTMKLIGMDSEDIQNTKLFLKSKSYIG